MPEYHRLLRVTQIRESRRRHNHARAALEIGTFAGGCFWGTQLVFQRLGGVVETCAGFTGGHTKSPTYAAVCTGRTGYNRLPCRELLGVHQS